jgi:hypothetical protein
MQAVHSLDGVTATLLVMSKQNDRTALNAYCQDHGKEKGEDMLQVGQ